MLKFLQIILLIFVTTDSMSQTSIVKYNQEENIAGIIYDDQKRPKKSEFPKTLPYPATGSYSPTHYANPAVGVDKNVGFCNYIYIPTQERLEPGKQYTLKLRIKFDESYNEMPFFQDNFGIALTDYLYPNSFPSHWGLWEHTNESLGIFEGGRIIQVEQEFRPLCDSKYLVLGVFRSNEMEHLHCFMCYYPFELYELIIEESEDPTKACKYFGDEFKKKEITNFEKNEFNIYFDSGSSKILPPYKNLIDSISARLKKTNDIITLEGHTDISGNNNIKLGADRNQTVKEALCDSGIDPQRIITYNLADDEAADYILSTDRRVQINIVKGQEHRQIYNSALTAIKEGDFPLAHKILIDSWINLIPPKKALTAYFDCWGDSKKGKIVKSELLKRVKNKFYKRNELHFKLDSLKHEWLKGRSLTAYLSMLDMPASNSRCNYSVTQIRDSLLRNEADAIYQKNGFVTKSLVGIDASHIIPELILTSDDVNYLEWYMPRFLEACKNRKLKWSYYARIYDKISILKTGLQRYGTVMNWYNSPPTPVYSFDNPIMVDEFRKQVKLAPFMSSVAEHQIRLQDNLDKELVKQLNNIYKADQFYRNKVHTANRYFPQMATSDSFNQIQIKKILDERGWLGADIVGERGNTTLFLVIQHSDLETQLKYLPMMREAVKEGNAKGNELALLEDRAALGQGKKQIYGSQIWKDNKTNQFYVAPLKDPENVNERRKEVNLISMEDYVQRWNIDWEKEKVKLKTREK